MNIKDIFEFYPQKNCWSIFSKFINVQKGYFSHANDGAHICEKFLQITRKLFYLLIRIYSLLTTTNYNSLRVDGHNLSCKQSFFIIKF